MKAKTPHPYLVLYRPGVKMPTCPRWDRIVDISTLVVSGLGLATAVGFLATL